ncbi:MULTISPECIES: hypothetical protein [unclassified Bradyrhizobium]|uniref:hypothetical protein n=1 Tax=unclassified Bradyrhizobium TaxID=2631580 RepID=UPI0028E588B0|nr:MULTISPECIES: hypothetical protein [unclassified Bradyrhizobium]
MAVAKRNLTGQKAKAMFKRLVIAMVFAVPSAASAGETRLSKYGAQYDCRYLSEAEALAKCLHGIAQQADETRLLIEDLWRMQRGSSARCSEDPNSGSFVCKN